MEARDVAGRRGLKAWSKGLLPAAAMRLRAEYGLPMLGDREAIDVPDMPIPTAGPYGLYGRPLGPTFSFFLHFARRF